MGLVYYSRLKFEFICLWLCGCSNIQRMFANLEKNADTDSLEGVNGFFFSCEAFTTLVIA